MSGRSVHSTLAGIRNSVARSRILRTTGAFRTYRLPTRIAERNRSGSAVAVPAGGRHATSTAAKNAYVKAFRPKTAVTPILEIRRPAIAGPISRARLTEIDPSAEAALSSLRGTSSGTSDW